MLGIWDNFAELESKISLEELELILDAAREQEHRKNKFTAALKGIDLDANNKEEIQDRFDKINARAQARLTGKSQDEIEFADLGIEVDTD